MVQDLNHGPRPLLALTHRNRNASQGNVKRLWIVWTSVVAPVVWVVVGPEARFRLVVHQFRRDMLGNYSVKHILYAEALISLGQIKGQK